jgi:pimeloyl-ACP methyl ester carboxylesterase
VVVGHSWGGSVALRAGATHPDRVSGLALIDGGLWSPKALGDREVTRERLAPPPLGIPEEDLWAMIRSGALGPGWSPELEDALRPTFREDEEGRLHSRLGLERHMRVLDGLLDVDPLDDLLACADAGVPIWAAVCEPAGAGAVAEAQWSTLKVDASAAAAAQPNVLIHRWGGAIHDVPLQWPDLVAGFIDSAVASAPVEGGRG